MRKKAALSVAVRRPPRRTFGGKTGRDRGIGTMDEMRLEKNIPKPKEKRE